MAIYGTGGKRDADDGLLIPTVRYHIQTQNAHTHTHTIKKSWLVLLSSWIDFFFSYSKWEIQDQELASMMTSLDFVLTFSIYI